MSYKFKGLRYIDYIDVSSFDTKEVVNMSSMFEDCNIRILSTSNFNTSKVMDMSNMFRDDYDLASLDVSNFDTKKAV